MQNDLGNTKMGRVENPELNTNENFFEQQGMMPNSDPKQVGNKVIDSFNQEPVAETEAENGTNLNAHIFGGEQVATELEGAADDQNEQKNTDRGGFSKGKNFTKNDGNIVEARIKKLKNDPATAYEEFQEDREEYQENSFGRTSGEQK